MTEIVKKENAVNPANEPAKAVKPEGYMPMSMGNQLLETPQRAGYHRRWFRGEPGRIARAQRAGYSFVKDDEVSLNSRDLGGDAKTSGNTDLGTHVSVVSGTGEDNQVLRMYLMEIPLELYEESRQVVADRNESVAAALRDGSVADQAMDGDVDTTHRTRKNENVNLFTKKQPKGSKPL